MIESIRKDLASIDRVLRSAHPSYSPRLTPSDLIRFEEGVKAIAAIPCLTVVERLTRVAGLCVRGLERSPEFVLGHPSARVGDKKDLALFIQIGSDLDAAKAQVAATLFLEMAWHNKRTDLLDLTEAGFDVNAGDKNTCALSGVLVLSKKSNTDDAVNAINTLLDVGARVTEDMVAQDLKPEIRALLEAAYLRQTAREGRASPPSKIARSPL